MVIALVGSEGAYCLACVIPAEGLQLFAFGGIWATLLWKLLSEVNAFTSKA